jgi:hypothetical protein
MKKGVTLLFSLLFIAGALGTAYFHSHKQQSGGCFRCPPNAFCPDFCTVITYRTSHWIGLTAGLLVIGIAGLIYNYLRMRTHKTKAA